MFGNNFRLLSFIDDVREVLNCLGNVAQFLQKYNNNWIGSLYVVQTLINEC